MFIKNKKKLRSFFALSMIAILIVGMLNLSNFASAEHAESPKPIETEEVSPSTEPSKSAEPSESAKPSENANKGDSSAEPSPSPSASVDVQPAVFSSYDKNKAQIISTLSKQSYASDTLIAQATVSVVGQSSVTSVYSGLRAEITDGDKTLKTLDLKDLGVGDIHNFTVQVSGLTADQFANYTGKLQLKVYLGDECVSTAAFAGGAVKGALQSPQNQGTSPIRLIVTPNASEQVVGGVIEKLTGNSMVASFTTSASAMEGVVVLIPIKSTNYSEIKFAALSSTDVKTGTLYDYSFTYEGATVSGDFLVAVIPNAGAGSFLASMSVEYAYKNGITPAGATQTITGYALQGERVSSGSLFGSGIAIMSNGAADKGAVYTYKAKLDEDITVEKSIMSVTDTDVIFPALKERDYKDVVAPEGTTDDYYVNYKIALKTSGNGKFEGRLFNNSVKITDTLSGFLATGVPKSVTVQKVGGGAVTTYDVNAQATSYTFSFDATVQDGQGLANQEYLVTVKYSKNDYTNRYNQTAILSQPQLISNTAKALVTPVSGSAKTVEGNTVQNAFGYVQEEPLTPSLSILKKIIVSNYSYTYDQAMQNLYGVTAAPVTFKLTPQGGGQALTSGVDANGKLKFENLIPGTTYTLSETVAVNSLFEKMTEMTVVVSPLDNNGLATVTVNGTDYTSKDLIVNNAGTYIGSIRAQVTKQSLYESPEKYTNYVGVTVYLYDEANLTTPIAQAITDSQGYVIFHNLDTRKTYKLVGTEEPSGNYNTPSLTSVVAKADALETFNLQYKSNKGSFKLGKKFVGPDGNAMTVAGFEVTFQLYKADGTTPVGNPIVLDSTGAKVVQQLYTAGTYVLKETGIKIGGVDATDQYTLFTGNTVTVTIEAGKYGVVAVDSASTDKRVDPSGVFSNKSAYGQLKIKNFDFNGGGLKNFTYTVERADGTGTPITVAMSASESEKTILVPAGTYKVTQTTKSGYILLTSNAVQVTVAGGTPVTDNISVTGIEAGQTRTLTGTGTSVQTVGFINAVLPNVSGTKVRKDNNAVVSGAQFALYVKSGANYVPYMSGGTHYKVSSNGSGVFTFASLPAGEYAFVESVVPAGYSTPAYVAAFYDGTTLKSSIPASSLGAAPKFTVNYSDYAAGTAKAVKITDNQENIRYAGVSINMGTTDKTISYVSGATFTLYNNSGVAIGTATPTSAAFVKFYDSASKELQLAPGTYTIRQTAMAGTASYYVMRDDVITVTVSETGAISASFASEVAGRYKHSAIVWDEANNTQKITFTNTIKPSIKFSKRGETNVFDDIGNRKKTALAGAEFIVQFKKGAATYYVQFDAAYNMTGVTATKSAATKLTSNAYGEVFINYLDPLQSESYKLVEVYAPPIPDTDLEYKLETWDITLGLVTSADATYYITGVDNSWTNDNGYVVISNEVDPHHIKIEKIMLQKDPSTGAITEIGSIAINGIFHVYRWDEQAGAYDMSKPVDIMKTGAGDVGNANSAFSRQLPVGKYLVVEVQAPIGAVPVGAANAALYVKENGVWVEKSSAAVDHVLQFEVVLGDDDNEVKDVTVGNIGASGGGSANFARLYGEKVGYVMDVNGTLTLQGPIMGVNFDVWLGYVDKTTGEYIKLSAEPYETVKSGSVWKDGKLESGQFLTGYVSQGVFQSLAVADGVAAEDIKNFAFILVEKGPLPENYRPIGSAMPEFTYDIDFTKSSLQTIGKNDVVDPVEIRNIAGEGFLRIRKYGQKDTVTPLTTANFEIYHATSATAPESEWQLVATVTPNADATASTYGLLPGYYFVKEVKAATGFNTFGQYSVNSGTKKSFDGVIGAIPIQDEKTPVLLSIYDKEYASLNLRNYWNGGVDTNVTADYKIEYVAGSNTYATQNITVTAGTAYTVAGLPDGTYKITQTALGGTKANEYMNNTAASTQGIDVVVAGGVVTSVKVSGATLPATIAGSTYDIICTAANTEVGVNFKSKGALVILKGYIDPSGVKKDSAPASLAAASFTLEKYDAGSWVFNQTINWTNADNTTGKKIMLDSGKYRIKEISASTGYAIDNTLVYFTIDAVGVVYLRNNNATYGIVSAEASPLTAATSGTKAFFYNSQQLGVLEIYKAASSTSSTYLAGAEFEIYTDKNDPDSKVAATFTDAGNKGIYRTELSPGTYYIKETKAPAGYDMQEDFFTVVVKANTTPVYKGYENALNANTIGILNPALVSINVEKVTSYPSIADGKGGVLLPESTARVASMPIELYKYNGTSYELVKEAKTAFGEEDYGTVAFNNLGAGKYKIVEYSPVDGSLDYLNLNQKYNKANIASVPVIEIRYNAQSNTLEIDGSAVGADWKATEKMLTINNQFIGVRFAAKKVDIETGLPVQNAVFELYENYDAETGAVSGKVSSNTIIYKTDSEGFVYFDPMYLIEGETYYIKEVSVPGYIIDPYYDTDVKSVTASVEGSQVLAVFKNKKTPAAPTLTTHKLTDAAPTTPLKDEGFSTTYTISQMDLLQTSLANELPLLNYTVKDLGPVFYGKNINNVDMIVPEVSSHKPTYTITSVNVYPATAKASFGSASAAVYANVNGTGWKLLVAPYTEFALGDNDQTITVVYSSFIPQEGQTPSVGTDFAPGKIEVGVTYNAFEPVNATQPEVSKIVNTVTINADYRDITKPIGTLKALAQATATATVELTTKERPKMDVEKELLTQIVKGPGETLEYKLTLTNKSTATGSGDESHLNIVNPVLVDVMQQNALFAAVDSEGKAIYTVAGDATSADVSACNMYEGGRVVEWRFDGLTLAPGESIEITYTAQLAAIINGETVDNAVFGTSSTPLSYSTKYPTGASFSAYNPAKAVSTGAEYDLLKGYTGIGGLYVKAEKNGVQVKRSGQVNAQRSISTDGSTWVSSNVALDVYPGDTIYYRLQVQNDGVDNAPSLENIRIADILPFLGDSKFVGSGSRGTQWTDDLVNLWKMSGNISVRNASGPVSDYTIKYSTARTLSGIESGAGATQAEANSFMITFGNSFTLPKSDTLTIVFSMKLPEYADFTDTMLQNNVRKTASASFLPIFSYLGSEFNNAESNVVKARLLLPQVNVTGTAWDDTNRDGIIDGTEQPLAGVPVSLYISNDNGVTFTQVGQTINSEADGSYEFTGLESSYGVGAPVYKVVFENASTTTKQFSPGVAFGSVNSADNKSHVANVSTDKTKGDTGIIRVLEDSIINCGINGVPSYQITYAAGTAGSDAAGIPVYNATFDNALQYSTYAVRGSSPVPTWPGSGYSFSGWKVTTDASGDILDNAYSAGQTFTVPGNNVVLTAQWTQNAKYNVTYTVASGVTGVQNLPATESVATGKDYATKGTGEAGDLTPTREGYTFAGWTVMADASATLTTTAGYYKPGTATSNFIMPANNVTLEAVWTKNSWSVTYTSEGTVTGMPTPAVVTGVEALSTYTLVSNEPARYQYEFKGWKVTTDASGKLNTTTGYYVPGTGAFTMPDNNVVLTAQWAPTYQVTYEGDGATSGVPSDTAWYEEDDSVTVKTGTPVKAGFAFKGWKVTTDASNEILNGAYAAGQTFDMPGNNVTLTAQWAPTYTVTYAGNGATSGVPTDTDRYEASVTYSVKAGTPIKAGFSFAGWTVTTDASATLDTTAGYYKAGTTTGSFAMPANNVTLTANWEENYWNVTYVSEGTVSGMPSPATESVMALSTYAVADNTPTRFGYNFHGWAVTDGKSASMADAYQPEGTFTMPDNDVELTAIWEPTYTVTYDGNGATSGVPSDTDRYEEDDTVDVKYGTPIQYGFTFAGWETNFDTETYEGGDTFAMPGKNAVLTATWTENYWNVTYVSEGTVDGMPDPATENVKALSTYTVADNTPTRFGYNFHGWAVTDGKVTGMTDEYQPEETFTMPDNDVELTAIWEPTYTVTYDGVGATSGVPADDARYEQTDTVIVKDGTPVRFGYAFKGWEADFDGNRYIAGADFAMPGADVVLRAIWEPTYTVTYNGNGATSGVPADDNRYEVSDTVTVLGGTPVRAGYVFKGWRSSIDSSNLSAGNTFAMPGANVVLTAIWDPTFTITYNGNGATSGVPTDNARYEAGDIATVLNSTPVRAGFTFGGWLYNGTIYRAGQTFVMPTGNVVLIAQWTANPEPSPSDSPSPSPSVSPSPSPSPSPTGSPKPTESTNPVVDINDPKIPLIGLGTNAWSLLSLLMSLAGLVIAILMIVSIFKRNKKRDEEEEYANDEEEEPRKKRSKLLKAFTAIVGVLVGIIWLLLDNLKLPMTFINGYTIYVGIAFIITIILLIVERSVKKKESEDTEDDKNMA